MTIIAHASCDEHKGIKNGQAGDQTKKEVCIRSWYNKPWNAVIRFKDAGKREKIAQLMEKAAANDMIGYDQNQRNTLLSQARKYNYDVSKVTEPCETDCSALVTLACIYAGVPESKLIHNGNSATTRTLVPLLKTTGEVDVYTSAAYLTTTEKLLRGDILIKEGSHVVVVTQTENAPKTALKSVNEIAKEVIAGKWGNGADRQKRLTDAGYDYGAVRKTVNILMKK